MLGEGVYASWGERYHTLAYIVIVCFCCEYNKEGVVYTFSTILKIENGTDIFIRAPRKDLVLISVRLLSCDIASRVSIPRTK